MVIRARRSFVSQSRVSRRDNGNELPAAVRSQPAARLFFRECFPEEEGTAEAQGARGGAETNGRQKRFIRSLVT